MIDIVFHDDGTYFYYFKKGIKHGLNLESLNAKVLNKTVTLHLPKLIFDRSKSIARLAVEDEIIFTEFD